MLFQAIILSKSFDSIVCTWTLCSVTDPVRALSEMRRVLKPNGKLYFIEHGLAPDEHIRVWQRRLNPIGGVIGGGCHLDRDIPALLHRAGLAMLQLDKGFVPGPKFAAFMPICSAQNVSTVFPLLVP